MPVDDHPFDALDRQFALEDTSVSPVSRAVLSIASSVPLPWPIDKAVAKVKEHIGSDSIDRIRLMLETCMTEVRRQGEEIRSHSEQLSRNESETREETAKELLLDAARKAEATRDKARVKRIGMILAHAAVGPRTIDSDEIEEMMRIAMDLSDQDVGLLRELVRIEGAIIAQQGRIDRYSAHSIWEHGHWGTRLDPEIESVFNKLESYGLVAPNSASKQPEHHGRFSKPLRPTSERTPLFRACWTFMNNTSAAFTTARGARGRVTRSAIGNPPGL